MLLKLSFLLCLLAFVVVPISAGRLPGNCRTTEACGWAGCPRGKRCQCLDALGSTGSCLPVEPRRECHGEACGKIGCPGRGTCLCSETGDWYCSGPRIGRQADDIE